MNTPNKKISLLTVAAATVASLYSHCARADDTGFYVGANVGHVLSTYGHHTLDTEVAAAFGNGFEVGGSSLRKDRTMWYADAGYLFSQNFGIEAAYINLGTLKYAVTGTEPSFFGGGTSNVSLDADFRTKGPALAAVGRLPMSNLWELDARLGAFAAKTRSRYSTTVDTSANSGSESANSTSLLAGVGTGLTLTSHCTLRIDYLRLQDIKEKLLNKSFNVNLVSAGLAFVF